MFFRLLMAKVTMDKTDNAATKTVRTGNMYLFPVFIVMPPIV